MKFHRNSNIFIQENVFDRVVCEMVAIFSRPHCVNIVSSAIVNDGAQEHVYFGFRIYFGDIFYSLLEKSLFTFTCQVYDVLFSQTTFCCHKDMIRHT